jgi:hypothetical protein
MSQQGRGQLQMRKNIKAAKYLLEAIEFCDLRENVRINGQPRQQRGRGASEAEIDRASKGTLGSSPCNVDIESLSKIDPRFVNDQSRGRQSVRSNYGGIIISSPLRRRGSGLFQDRIIRSRRCSISELSGLSISRSRRGSVTKVAEQPRQEAVPVQPADLPPHQTAQEQSQFHSELMELLAAKLSNDQPLIAPTLALGATKEQSTAGDQLAMASRSIHPAYPTSHRAMPIYRRTSRESM